jgi:AraC-like DNA-binding protein
MDHALGHRWTVESLAEEAVASRTAFTLQFKKTRDLSSMACLKRRRMLQAAELLATSRQSLAEISSSLGYESQKSFSLTFKHVMRLLTAAVRPRGTHRSIAS